MENRRLSSITTCGWARHPSGGITPTGALSLPMVLGLLFGLGQTEKSGLLPSKSLHSQARLSLETFSLGA